MKTLKFRPALIEPILKGKKKTTWRLFDEKEIKKDEKVMLVNWVTKEEFAKAKIISVRNTTFSELKKEDFENHEDYFDKKSMYQRYTKFYKKKVDEKTPLKIIKFELIK